MDLLLLLQRMRVMGATDLLLSSGIQPAFRVNGKLAPRTGEILTAAEIERMARRVVTEEQMEMFNKNMELNLGSTLANLGRFRINIFRQRGDIAIAVRSIPNQVPSCEELRLPDALKQVAMLKRGLILVVGACGSGKSTTLASLIDYRSRHDMGHIITIEDPVEYMLPHRESMVNQREIGVDTRSYHEALINSLRQSPDVLMIGEIRDRQTMERAIEFSDTGQLCLSTLHCNNANMAFDRILNFFQENEREQILISLSQNIRAVVSQRLVPTIDGARTAAFELLLHTPRVSELIRKCEFGKLKELMERSHLEGMSTFDQSLYALRDQNVISDATALEYADSVTNLRLRIKLASNRPEVSHGT